MSGKTELIKSATLTQYLNGKKPSQTLMKALTVGQTKVKNGVTYIVKMTPSGKLDWRVLKVAGSKDEIEVEAVTKTVEDLFDTKDFPELDDIKIVSDLGGSTGAKLVEDSSGKQYVMKKGNSREHVEEEFTANSIYALFGVKVANQKLYKGKTESVLLSEFMPNTTAANNIMDDQLAEDITEHFILDCLLANWDIYKNDNILINTDDGSHVRVDNGGALRFSAQGRPKGEDFGEEVIELDTMAQHNPRMVQGLTDAKMKKQVKKILVRGENIISLIDDQELKDIMYERLMDLKEMVSTEEKDPYRELKERDLAKAMRKAGSMTAVGKNGWKFLEEICKLRGFDKPPTVISNKEFEKEVKKKKALMVNRGLTGSYGKTAKDFMNEFATGEECFFGSMAMYGAGIYGAVNADKKNPPPANADYEIALGYAGYEPDHVMDLIIPEDAKIIDGDELDQMMNEEFFGEEFKEKKKEYDEALEEFNEMKMQKEAIEDEIESDVKKEMGWNEKTFMILQKSKPELVYADTEKYPFRKGIKYFKTLLNSIAGDLKPLDGHSYEVTLPNTNKTFIINEYTASASLKQKDAKSVPYNYHYQRVKEFIMKEHYSLIRGKVAETVKERRRNDPKVIDIVKKLDDAEKHIEKLSAEVYSLKTGGSSTTNDVMAQIINRPGGTYRGFYAAIKGYDAIISKNGWGSSTDFAVILNRSKIKVRAFDDGK